MSVLNGVTFNRTGNPQADLVNYASARGISEDQAKAELQSAFGEPQQSNFSFNSTDDEDAEFSLSGNPEADARRYADLNNISLSSAISKLKELYGEPKVAEGEIDEIENEEADDESEASTESTSSSSTAISSSSSSSANTKAQNRKNLQNEIAKWSAKLKQATDASDKWGIMQAQATLRNLQTQAYSWDSSYYNF